MTAPAANIPTARKRVIAELDPVAPPGETIAAIQQIAEEERVGDEYVPVLIDAFLHHYNIDADELSPVAILRSGRRVVSDGDDGELLDRLITAVLEDSTKASDGKPVQGEIVQEVDHVVANMHAAAVRALLREALMRLAVDRSRKRKRWRPLSGQ